MNKTEWIYQSICSFAPMHCAAWKLKMPFRRLPLRELLEPNELTLLIDWYRERQG